MVQEVGLDFALRKVEGALEIVGGIESEDLRKQPVQESPAFHKIVLQRRAGQEEAILSLQALESVRDVGLLVLDLVPLIKDAVPPYEGTLKPRLLSDIRIVCGHDDVDPGGLSGDTTVIFELVALNLGTVEANGIQPGRPLLRFIHPRAQHA